MKKKKALIFSILLTAILIGFDQITKYFAEVYLKGSSGIPLIKDVLKLEYLENKGASFGMLPGAQLLFIIMSILFSVVMLYILWRIPDVKRNRMLFVLDAVLTAGASGNLIDRLCFHYVRDFIYFELINFPIFNLADIYITVGAVVLILLIFFFYKDEDFVFLKRKKEVANHESE